MDGSVVPTALDVNPLFAISAPAYLTRTAAKRPGASFV
jgi:hypothetical protein